MRKQMKIRMATMAVIIGATSAVLGTAAQAGPREPITSDPGSAVRDVRRGNRSPRPLVVKPVDTVGDKGVPQVEGCSRRLLGSSHPPRSGLCGNGSAVARLTGR